MRPALLLVLCALLTTVPVEAQRRRAPAPTKPAPPPPAALKTEPAAVKCSELLGTGIKTHATFCFVLAGRDPAQGVLVSIPPHTGTATLTFSLHNRHTYSEEQIKTNRAYHRYTATIGVLALDNTLLSRFYVQSEFRTPGDLVDRIRGGSGPGGLKAVAPTGTEPITIVVTEDDAKDGVSILGEKLSVVRVDGADTFTAPGRPIAVISNVMLEYRPAPAAKPAPARRR